MEKEIFRDVKGFENFRVSNYGNVKSLNYGRTGKEKNLKPYTNGDGYLNVNFYEDKKRKTFRVHRLVAEAFPEICGELFEGCEVDHIDTNKENNNANNLRCVTPMENSNNPLTKKHMSEAHKGLKHSEAAKEKISEANKGKKMSEAAKKKIGEAQKGKIVSEETRKKLSKIVLQIDPVTNDVIAEFPSTREVERKLGFASSNISNCCNGKRKTCHEFIWKYK